MNAKSGQDDLRIGFIGAGRVATALARGLQSAGYIVAAVSSRTRESAGELSDALGGMPAVLEGPQPVADHSTLVFITTPDDTIAEVAGAVTWRGDHRVVHCSGALPMDVLHPAVEAGGQAASFHPMQTFARPRSSATRTGRELAGITFAVEGHGDLLDDLREIARRLGGAPITVPSEKKALYHIAGVLSSNYVVTLVNQADEALRTLGIPAEDGLKGIVTLLKATVDNIEAVGPSGALTGPIARGDVGSVRRHLDVLDQERSGLAEAYRALGRLTLPLAAAKGNLDRTAEERLRDLLEQTAPAQAGARMPAMQEV